MTKTFSEKVAEIKAERAAWPLKKKVNVWFRRKRNKLRNTDWLWRHRHKQNKQRIQKGYSYRDLWSFDTYLAGVISKGLIELRDVTHSYPCDTSMEEWAQTLTEMASGFDAWANMWDEAMYDGDYLENMKALEAKLNKSMDLFKEHFGSLWD